MRLKKITHKLNKNVIEHQIIGWAELLKKDINTDFEVKNIRKAIWREIHDIDKNYLNHKRCIVELNMKTSGMGQKRTYVNCSIMLYKISDWNEKTNTDLINTIVKNVFESNQYFKFYDTKV